MIRNQKKYRYGYCFQFNAFKFLIGKLYLLVQFIHKTFKRKMEITARVFSEGEKNEDKLYKYLLGLIFLFKQNNSTFSFLITFIESVTQWKTKHLIKWFLLTDKTSKFHFSIFQEYASLFIPKCIDTRERVN